MRHPFWRGVASIMDIGGTLGPRLDDVLSVSDADAIRSDWDAIADDFPMLPDHPHPRTWQEMAAEFERITIPDPEPYQPLPFDPDDYPFR